MEDKHLDKLFKDTLGDFEMDYDPNSWDELSNKLDDEVLNEGSDEQFDDAIRQQMDQLSEPYNRQSWLVFLNRLETMEINRLRLITSKISEAVLMVLLVLTLVKYYPFIQSYDTDQMYALITNPLDKLKTNDSFIEIEPMVLEGVSVQQSSDYLKNQDGGRDTRDQGNDQSSSNLIEAVQDMAAHFVAATHRNTEDVETIELLTLNEVGQGYPYLLSALKTTSGQSGSIALLDEDSELLELSENYKLWLNRLRGSASGSRLSIAFFLSANINQIHTPYDLLYNRDDYYQNRGGFGGGVTLMWNLDRLSIETGIQYSAKSYAPEKVVELFSPNEYQAYKAVSLEEIDLSIISVPLNFIYRFDNDGRWRFYTLAGMSAQTAASVNYDRDQKDLAFPSSPFRSEAESQYVNSSNRSILDSKDFSQGVFRGGSFKDNFFITLNAGLGAEYMVSENMRFYAQPQYQFNFFNTGLGPNDDRINIFSLQLGARVDLNP